MAKQATGTKVRIDADIEKSVWQKCLDDDISFNRVCNDLLRDWLGGRVKIEGKSAGKVAAEDEGLVKQLHHIREWNSAVWQSLRGLIDGLAGERVANVRGLRVGAQRQGKKHEFSHQGIDSKTISA